MCHYVSIYYRLCDHVAPKIDPATNYRLVIKCSRAIARRGIPCTGILLKQKYDVITDLCPTCYDNEAVLSRDLLSWERGNELQYGNVRSKTAYLYASYVKFLREAKRLEVYHSRGRNR